MGGWHDDVVDMVVGLLTMTIVRNSEIYNHLMALQPVNTGFAPVYGYQKWMYMIEMHLGDWQNRHEQLTSPMKLWKRWLYIYLYLYIYIYNI